MSIVNRSGRTSALDAAGAGVGDGRRRTPARAATPIRTMAPITMAGRRAADGGVVTVLPLGDTSVATAAPPVLEDSFRPIDSDFTSPGSDAMVFGMASGGSVAANTMGSFELARGPELGTKPIVG